MSIKTLHITNYFHPTSGGIRTFYLALMDAANRLRRPMRLVVPGETNRIQEVGDYGRIYHVKAPRAPAFDRRYRMILPHTFALPHETGLREILRLEQPDLVEICDKYSLCWLAGMLRRNFIPGVPRPTLVGLSCERMDDNVGSYVTSSLAVRHLTAYYVRNIYIPLFDFHIANSGYVSAELTAAFPALGDRLRVLPMGVQLRDLGSQHRDPALRARLQKESGGDGRSNLLLYVGRLSPEKNLGLLVNMLEELINPAVAGYSTCAAGASPDSRLLLAGSGPLEPWLRQQGHRLGGRLHLLGHVESRAEMARLLASVDVFIHPNPREPFGIGPLEAMASGTPLVAPNAGGVIEYANEACAWLVNPESRPFAGAVREILSRPLETSVKVEKARRVAERHNWQNVTSQFFDAYESCHAARQSLASIETQARPEYCETLPSERHPQIVRP